MLAHFILQTKACTGLVYYVRPSVTLRPTGRPYFIQLATWVCTIQYYGPVIYENWTHFIVS